MSLYLRLIFFYFFINNFFMVSTGIVTGYVIDKVTHNFISGANVVIKKPSKVLLQMTMVYFLLII